MQKKATMSKKNSQAPGTDLKKQATKKDTSQIESQKSQEVAVVVPVFAGDTFKFGNLPKPKMTQYSTGIKCDSFEQEEYAIQLERKGQKLRTGGTRNLGSPTESPARRLNTEVSGPQLLGEREPKKKMKDGEQPLIYDPSKEQVDKWLHDSKQMADDMKKLGRRENTLKALPKLDESPLKSEATNQKKTRMNLSTISTKLETKVDNLHDSVHTAQSSVASAMESGFRKRLSSIIKEKETPVQQYKPTTGPYVTRTQHYGQMGKAPGMLKYNNRVNNPINYMRDTQGYRFTKKMPSREWARDQSAPEKDKYSTTNSAVFSPTNTTTSGKAEENDQPEAAKQQRRLLMSHQPRSRYGGDLRPTYANILRQQLDSKKDRPVITNEGAQAWYNVIQVQDKLEDYRQQAENVIKKANTSLNPYFYNDDLRYQHNPGFGHQDKVPQETRTRRRVKVINVMACKNRVLNINEDVGILGYMARNQLNGQGKLAADARNKQNKVLEQQKMIRMLREDLKTLKIPQDHKKIQRILHKLEELPENGYLQSQLIHQFQSASSKHPMLDRPKEQSYHYEDAETEKESQDEHNIKSNINDPHLTQPTSGADVLSHGVEESTEPQALPQQTEEGAAISDNAKQQSVSGISAKEESSKAAAEQLDLGSGHSMKSASQRSQYESIVSANKKIEKRGHGDSVVDSGSAVLKNGSTSKVSMPSAAQGGSNSTYMDSDFWYHKGVILNQRQQGDKQNTTDESALHCYLQAFKLNQSHTPSIFNLACSYQKLKQYEQAKVWFKHAINERDEWPEAHFGLALCCIRLNCFAEAVKHIEMAVQHTKGQLPSQLQYTRALCHRQNEDYERAEKEYQVVMKNEETIFDFTRMIDRINVKKQQSNLSEDSFNIEWRIDLFGFFQKNNWLPAHRPGFQIDLWPYYEAYEGWNYDLIPQVINLLQKETFFNRFDPDTLRLLLGQVTFRKIEQRGVLFLEQDESAIVVSGQLYCFLHSEDVACPQLSAIYNAGDIIGFSEIDNGLSRDEHTWVCAPHQADIFVISIDYIKYLWDKMKRFDSALYVDLLQENLGFQRMSEQTLFKMAQDLIQIREYGPGEVITTQDKRSVFNLRCLTADRMMNKFHVENKEHSRIHKQFQSDMEPKLSTQWNHVCLANKLWEKYKLLQLEKQKLGFVSKEQQKQNKAANSKAPLVKTNTENSLAAVSSDHPAGSAAALTSAATKALECLKPDYAKRQEERELKELLVDDKINLDVIEVSEEHKSVARNALSLIEKNNSKLQTYSKERKALPDQSDGLYFLIDGEVNVVNQYDKTCFQTLKPNSCFGYGRFLSCQGYAFFGDIIAAGKEPAMCLFISHKDFHKIPFFDWYRLREVTYKNSDHAALTAHSKEKYWTSVIRTYRKKLKNNDDQ